MSSSEQIRQGSRPRNAFVSIVLMVAVAAFYAPMFAVPQGLGSGDPFRDADVINAFFRYAHQAHSVRTFGEFALRTPYLGGGYPIIADPVEASLMPFVLIVLVFGDIVGYKLLAVFCAWIGAMGTYCLARRVMSLSFVPSLFAGVAFAFFGWMANQAVEGMTVFFMLVAPAMLWVILDDRLRTRERIYAGVAMGLFLSGPFFLYRFTLLVAAMWLVFIVAQAAARRGNLSVAWAWLTPGLLALISTAGAAHRPPIARFLCVIALLGVASLPAIRRSIASERHRILAAVLVVGVAIGVGFGRIAATTDLANQGKYRRMNFPNAGVEEKVYADRWNFYNSAGEFLAGLTGRAPLYAEYGADGQPAHLEYGYLGLGYLLPLFAVAGAITNRRRYAPLIGMAAIVTLAAFGPHWPGPDIYLWFFRGLPTMRFVNQPIKYLNPSIALFVILLAAAFIETASRRVQTRNARYALIAIAVAALAHPFFLNRVCFAVGFSRVLPELPLAPSFHQVLSARTEEIARRGLAAVRADNAKHAHLREMGRPDELNYYLNMRRNVGTIDWYNDIAYPEAAIPRDFILPDGRSIPNPGYRGEAWFAAPQNKVITNATRSNSVLVQVDVKTPGYLIVNQNFHHSFRSSTGDPVVDRDGLLAVYLRNRGEYEVVLHYQPVRTYLYLGFSAMVLMVSLWVAHRTSDRAQT
ncbi:hypothetical protein K8I61_06705 [bacterium]|nr:hypothetical protein [bacterium]